VAMAPPTGPVFISLPGDILNDRAAVELGSSTRVLTAGRPSDEECGYDRRNGEDRPCPPSHSSDTDSFQPQ